MSSVCAMNSRLEKTIMKPMMVLVSPNCPYASSGSSRTMTSIRPNCTASRKTFMPVVHATASRAFCARSVMESLRTLPVGGYGNRLGRGEREGGRREEHGGRVRQEHAGRVADEIDAQKPGIGEPALKSVALGVVAHDHARRRHQPPCDVDQLVTIQT